MARKEVNDTVTEDVPAFVLEEETTQTRRKAAVYDLGEEGVRLVAYNARGIAEGSVRLTRCEAKQLGAVLYGQGNDPAPLEFPAELITSVDWYENNDGAEVTVALSRLPDALREKLRELQ